MLRMLVDWSVFKFQVANSRLRTYKFTLETEVPFDCFEMLVLMRLRNSFCFEHFLLKRKIFWN